MNNCPSLAADHYFADEEAAHYRAFIKGASLWAEDNCGGPIIVHDGSDYVIVHPTREADWEDEDPDGVVEHIKQADMTVIERLLKP